MSASRPPARPARIIVATHGDLARALLRAVESIAGPQPDIACLGLAEGESPEVFEARLAAALASDTPALVLVDFPGGTPWNAALRAARARPHLRLVSGVNLPMLLDVALLPAADPAQLAAAAVDAGLRSIQSASADLPAPASAAKGHPAS